MRILPLIVSLLLASPLMAQTEVVAGAFTGIVPFNPLDIERFETGLPFILDEAYTARTGRQVRAVADMVIPTHPNLHMEVFDPQGPDDFLELAFSQNANDPRDRVFLESFRVIAATIPMEVSASDPALARMEVAADLLQNALLPRYEAEFPDLEVLDLAGIDFAGAPNSVQMVFRYHDPAYDAQIMTRAAIMTNPLQDASYLAIAQINLDMIPVRAHQSITGTVSGRILTSWIYP